MSPSYYDWNGSRVACPSCAWAGTGAETTLSETFDFGAEYVCPRCGHSFGFVVFPTHDDVLTDPRASEIDRRVVELQRDRYTRHDQSKLRTLDQLPVLDPTPPTLTWDVSGPAGGDSEVVILAGERVIWRELSFYENYARFVEIASLLHRKYGPALTDLEPTPYSEVDLYGDRLAASGIVERARAALGRGEDPAVIS